MYFCDNKNCRKYEQKKVESDVFAQVESDGAVIALAGWELFPDSQVPAAKPYLLQKPNYVKKKKKLVQNSTKAVSILMHNYEPNV